MVDLALHLFNRSDEVAERRLIPIPQGQGPQFGILMFRPPAGGLRQHT
jgi:hypothetical protein